MSPARILILTSSHLCRNPRVVKEAVTLGAAGYDVTVLTVSNRADFEQLDLGLAAGLPFRRVTIDHTGRGLAGVIRRGSTWAARRAVRHLGAQLPAALGPAHVLLRRASAFRADLVIAHTEIPLWAARHLILAGRRVAVDLEDWYSEDLLPADRASRPLTLLRLAEQFALRHAAYTSTTSQCMASALAAAYGGRPPIVLRNVFPLQPDPFPSRPGSRTPPRLVWFSQTIGPGRGLEAFLAGWSASATPSQVTLIGAARPDYCQELLRSLRPALRSRLEFKPPVPPQMLPARLAEFDLGLALEPRDPANRNLTISNKLFQYFNAGLAVIATDTAGQAEILRGAPECGRLIPPDHAAGVTVCLDELLADPAALFRMQQAARAAAMREFCWEKESPRLLATVAHSLKQPPPVQP